MYEHGKVYEQAHTPERTWMKRTTFERSLFQSYGLQVLNSGIMFDSEYPTH